MATLKPQTGIRLTKEEFLELPDTEDRRKMELDGGELYIMPRPRRIHQFWHGQLFWHIENYIRTSDEPPAEVFVDFVVGLSLENRTLLEPDLCVVLRERLESVGDRMVEGAPDIAVEILSSDRRRDLVRKRQLYAEAGVSEYWIFDPVNDAATLLDLHGDEYVERAVLGADGVVTTVLLPGLEIPLADVFNNPRRPGR